MELITVSLPELCNFDLPKQNDFVAGEHDHNQAAGHMAGHMAGDMAGQLPGGQEQQQAGMLDHLAGIDFSNALVRPFRLSF